MIEVSSYGARIVGPAETELGRQLGTDTVGEGVNLTRIWREAGRPEGRDPESWFEGVGAPIVGAYSVYAEHVWPEGWYPEEGSTVGTLWERSGGMLDAWGADADVVEAGDISTLQLPLALAYAIYLD